MAHRRDPEYDEYGNPIMSTTTGGRRTGGLGAPGTTGAEGTFDPLGAPGSTGAEHTASGFDSSGGQGQLRRPSGTGGTGGGHLNQDGGRTGISTTEGYSTFETRGTGHAGGGRTGGYDTGMGTTGGRGGYDTGMGTGTGGQRGYDTGMGGSTGGLGTGYDTGMGATTGGLDTGGMGHTTTTTTIKTTGGTGTGYDTGMGSTATGRHGTTGYDTGGTTGGYRTGTAAHDVGMEEDVDTGRQKKGITETILEHIPGTGRRSQ